MPTFNPSNTADRGYILFAVEAVSGTPAVTLVGMPFIKPVKFTEKTNVKTPQELRNTLAGVTTIAGGIRTIDFEVKKNLYLEMDPWLLFLYFGTPVTATATGTTTRTWTADNAPALNTGTIVHYDGGFARQYSYLCGTDLELDFGPDKEAMLTLKGYGRDLVELGSVPAYTQPIDHDPIEGWQVNVYIDEPGGTFGTTQTGDVMDGKITLSTGQDRLNTLANSRYFTKIKRHHRDIKVELTLDFATRGEYDKFRSSAERLVRIEFVGAVVPTGGTVVSKLHFDIPMFYDTLEIDDSADNTMLKVVGRAMFDAGQLPSGWDYQVVATNSQDATVYAAS